MSSVTCCSALEESARSRVNEFQSNCDSYGTPVHGFEPGMAARRAPPTRRRREFTPEEQKDDTYWLKRSRNNESAKRSRLRRRMEECLLEVRAVELLRENEKLKAALSAIHYHNIGVKNHFDGGVMGQAMCRDTCLAPLPGTDSPCYGFSSRAPVQCLGPSYDSVCLPGMENFPTHNVYQKDRSVGCELGIPGYKNGDPHSPPQCMPVAYETCQSHGLPDMSSSHNSYPGPLSRGEMLMLHGPKPADNGPGYGMAHSQAQEGSSPVTKEISSEMKPSKEAERASGLPLLPHKLRYKVSKAWRDANHPQPAQRVPL